MVIVNDMEALERGGDPSTTVALPTLAAVDVTVPAPAELPLDALQRLPELGAGGGDPDWRLVSAFLVGYPPHSSRAYFGDLKAWYAWCASASVHPLQARRHHVDIWCATSPRRRSRRPAGRRRRRRSPGGCRA